MSVSRRGVFRSAIWRARTLCRVQKGGVQKSHKQLWYQQQQQHQQQYQQQYQKGAALLLTLTLVLILSILGIASIQTTGLREKMARNNRDTDIAFQAAMAAILEAEASLEKITSLAALPAEGGPVTCAQGRCQAAPHGDRHAPSTYTPGTAKVGGAQAGRYLIEYMGDPHPSGEPMENVIAQPHIFRITARGMGKTSAATAMIQTSYGKQLTPDSSTPSDSTGRLSWQLLDATAYD